MVSRPNRPRSSGGHDHAAQPRTDSPEYLARKARFDRLLTIYGRKPVLEALEDPALEIAALHLADSNRSGGIIDQIIALANRRGVTIRQHSKQALSRISRNSREDQGVAADLALPVYQPLAEWMAAMPATPWRLLALDRITNPQNLGMILRSACAGRIDAVLLPDQGCAPLSPLVIKASAGTLFRTPILRCGALADALLRLRENAEIVVLAADGEASLFDPMTTANRVFVLGNESDGVTPEISSLANRRLYIPMQRGVESLNVAITAALIAYAGD